MYCKLCQTCVEQLYIMHPTYRECSAASISTGNQTALSCCHGNIKYTSVQEQRSSHTYRKGHVPDDVFTARAHHLRVQTADQNFNSNFVFTYNFSTIILNPGSQNNQNEYSHQSSHNIHMEDLTVLLNVGAFQTQCLFCNIQETVSNQLDNNALIVC